MEMRIRHEVPLSKQERDDFNEEEKAFFESSVSPDTAENFHSPSLVEEVAAEAVADKETTEARAQELRAKLDVIEGGKNEKVKTEWHDDEPTVKTARPKPAGNFSAQEKAFFESDVSEAAAEDYHAPAKKPSLVSRIKGFFSW